MTQPLSNPAASHCAPLPPHRAGAKAHCQRVAAVVGVLARRLQFDRRLTGLAVEAARLHHDWPALLGPAGRGRLLEDLDARVAPAAAPALPPELQAVLDALRPAPSRACPATPAAAAARLVDLACCFVERWEYQPYEARTFREIAAEIQQMAADGIFLPEHAAALADAPAVDDRQVAATMATLPVFPAVAAQALKVTRNPRSGLDEVEAIIRSDQVIAGEILRLANSPLLSPRHEISTIRQAIAYVGFECTCRVLSALLLRPMFNSEVLRPLWKHSVELAGLAVSIASLSGAVEPEEAFLAALLHDIGRLVLYKLPDNGEHYLRLLAMGIEPLFAEVLLC
ncbi:MAG: HDOD domain-containing protein, partial [Gemmataceae bacterium]|nr:HDOD domain-containing protein [Gemmataceae bacterium]